MTLRVQCDKVGGEYVAKLGDLTASADTRTNAVEAAHRETEPAPAREAAHDGESMGDGPAAPLGSHLGD